MYPLKMILITNLRAELKQKDNPSKRYRKNDSPKLKVGQIRRALKKNKL